MIKQDLEFNTRPKKSRPLDFLFLLMIGAVIPASLAIRLMFLEKNFGLESSLIVPFTVLTFLPLLLINNFYGNRPTWAAAILTGITQALFITHQPATFVFWILFGLFLTIFTSWQIEFDRRETNRWIKPLVLLLPLFLVTPVLVSISTFLVVPGETVKQMCLLFQMLWKQTFIIWITFGINSVLVLVLNYAGVLEASNKKDKGIHTITEQFLPLFTAILAFLWFIVLIQATFLWNHSHKVTVDSLANELQETSAFVASNYTLFLDYGRNSIQETAQILAGNSYGNEQQTLFDLLPFFQQIVLYDNESGNINQVTLEPSFSTLPDSVSAAILLIQESNLPYQVVAAPSDDTLNADTMFYFLAPINGTQQTLVGVVDAKFHPMIESSLQLLPDEAEWSLNDSQGGSLYSSLSYADQIKNDLHLENEKAYIFLPSSDQWLFKNSNSIGQFEVRISIAVNQELIIERQLRLVGTGLLLLFSGGIISSLIALVILALLRHKVNDLSLAISRMGTESFQTSITRNGMPLQSLYSALNNAHLQIKQEAEVYSDWVAFLHGLSLIHSYEELIEYLRSAGIFAAFLSIRFIIFNDTHQFLTNRLPNRFGKGSFEELMAVYDGLIEQQIKNQQTISFQINNKEKQISSPQKVQEMPKYVQAWALGTPEHDFGFIWIASTKKGMLKPVEEKFFHLFVKELSRVIASFRFIQQIQTENRRTRSVIAAMPEPILVFDREWKLVLLNLAAEKLRGLQKNKIKQGMPMDTLINDPTLKSFLKNTLQHRTTVEELTLMDNKVYSGVLSIISGAGQADWIICALHDVSTYQRKDTIRSEFLEAVGKYLQMPFQMVKGYLGMLTKVGDLNRAQMEYAGMIQGNIEEMEQFVSGILDINRIRSGAGLKIESVYAIDIIRDTVKRIYPSVKQNRIDFTVTEMPDREATRFEVDSTLFSQALYILFDNAVKFNKRDGKVELQLACTQEEMIFTVKDTGIGIAPLDLENIFRTSGYEAAESGTNHRGISLALAKSIIERHHGKIRVASWLGSGSIFTITMPLTQEKNRNGD